MAVKISKGKEAYYARYKTSNTQAKNRKLKLERQLKLQPNNEQVKQALKDIYYRRKTPGANTWSASGIRQAKLFKEFCGHFDKEILSSNAKQASDALQKLNSIHANFKLPKAVMSSVHAKAMFSLEARASM